MSAIEVIDLSKEVSESTYVLTEQSGYTDPPIRFETWTTIQEKGYCVTAIHMGLHAGTHCDVSSHYVMGGRPITDFPVSNFIGWAVTLRLKGKGPITKESLLPYREKIEGKSEVVVVVQNTRDDPFTREGRDTLASWRPKLIVSGAGWNLDENYYESDYFHRRDIPLIMNPDTDRLDEVRDGDLIVGLPLRLLDLEASPVRLVAIRGLEASD